MNQSSCLEIVNSALHENDLYLKHLSGSCLCLLCKCGKCRCPFAPRKFAAHQKARSLYQSEFYAKQLNESICFNADKFLLPRRSIPLDIFRVPYVFKSAEYQASCKPDPRQKVSLEEFSQQSSYTTTFKQLPIQKQEPIKPLNSLQVVKDVPYFHKSSYALNFRKYKPTNITFDGPNKSKDFIGTNVSYAYRSRYQDDFMGKESVKFEIKKAIKVFDIYQIFQKELPVISKSYKGQFDSSSKRSFQPHITPICPAKEELQNPEYNTEKYKIFL
ncbi:hypothetical protein pb186bvf_020587 [Paramecium bursaria]